MMHLNILITDFFIVCKCILFISFFTLSPKTFIYQIININLENVRLTTMKTTPMENNTDILPLTFSLLPGNIVCYEILRWSLYNCLHKGT